MIESTVGMVGDLYGIMCQAMPVIDAIEDTQPALLKARISLGVE